VPKRIKLTDQVRQSVKTCGLTRYRIWKETGIDQSTLARFAAGRAGLSMRGLDKLADLLDLNITSGRSPATQKAKVSK